MQIDYFLGMHLAQHLLHMAINSPFGQSGQVFAINMANFAGTTSLYFQPTRESFLPHKQEWDPQEVANTVLSHIPGGRDRITAKVSVVRTMLPVVPDLSLENLPVEEGLSQVQSVSKHLFLHAGIMSFYTVSGRMVLHTLITQPWAANAHAPANRSDPPTTEE